MKRLYLLGFPLLMAFDTVAQLFTAPELAVLA